jgi:hypothetical protein
MRPSYLFFHVRPLLMGVVFPFIIAGLTSATPIVGGAGTCPDSRTPHQDAPKAAISSMPSASAIARIAARRLPRSPIACLMLVEKLGQTDRR